MLAVAGGAEEERFMETVRSIALSAACDFVQCGAEELDSFRPKGRAALIWYLDGAEPEEDVLAALKARGVAVYVYARRGQSIPEGLAGLRYEEETAPEKALLEALNYENHDTPVRLIGLFASKDSGAAALWARAVDEGKILDKGAYYARETDRSAEDWLLGQLSGLYAGMLDGVYCESAALALTATELMKALDRDDAEIFAADADAALLKQMSEDSALLVRAVGPDPSEAGRLCAEQAIVLLYGGTAQQLAIRPSVFAAP